MNDAEQILEDAHTELAMGNIQAARDSYKKATELFPQNAEAWHALAMTSLKLGDADTAINAGLRATELNPNEGMYWTSLSLAFVRQNKIAEAEAASARAKVISWGGKIAVGGWEGLRLNPAESSAKTPANASSPPSSPSAVNS